MRWVTIELKSFDFDEENVSAVLPITIFNNFSTIFSGFFFTYRWRFNKDIKLMSGSEPMWYFKAAWMLGTPATLAVRQRNSVAVLVFGI